jgi:hypothetical protein
MPTLKTFNSLTPEKQCEFIIDLIENSPVESLATLIDDGVEQGESKDNLVKILRLLRSINKGQRSLVEDLTPLWIQTAREDKLNELLT